MSRRAEDKELGRLEGQAASFESRFDRLDVRFDTLEKRRDANAQRIFDKIDKQFGRCNVRIGHLETGQAVSKARIAAGVFLVSLIVSGAVAYAMGKLT